MSKQHRRFLIVDECIVAAVVCFLVNVALGWIFFHSRRFVPLFGLSSIVGDTVGMAFMLPLFTAIGATFLVGRAVVLGKLPPLSVADVARSRWLRFSGWQRGALVGLASIVVVAAPALIVLHAIGTTQLSLSNFIWLKGALAALIGILVTPLIGWWALVEASRAAHLRGQVP